MNATETIGRRLPLLREAAIRAVLHLEQRQTGVAMRVTDAVRRDPAPLYAQLRRQDPVHWSRLGQLWIVTRYADVRALLHDPRLTADRRGAWPRPRADASVRADEPFGRWFAGTLPGEDAPPARRRRRELDRALRARGTDLRAMIHETVGELLAPGIRRGHLNFATEVAAPLPLRVMEYLLGLPRLETDRVRAWTAAIATGFEPRPAPPVRRRANAAAAAALDPERAASLFGRPTHPALASLPPGLLGFMLFAGTETTATLITAAVWLLLTHPQLLAAVRAGAVPVRRVVDEAARLESPVQFTTRVALEDCLLGGRRILRGQAVALSIGAANTDPVAFPCPETPDPARPFGRHLAFGGGPHACLGEWLARLEAEVTLERLLAVGGAMAVLAPGAERRDTLVIRGISRLPLAIGQES